MQQRFAVFSWCAGVLVGLAACGSNKPASDSATSMIGAAGGTLSTTGGASVTVPAGAVSASTPFTIALASSAVPANIATAVGPVYQFGPSGVTFAQPVTITLPFDASKVPAGSDLSVFAAPDGTTQFTSLGRATLVSASSASAQTTHFTAMVVAIPGCQAPCTQGETSVVYAGVCNGVSFRAECGSGSCTCTRNGAAAGTGGGAPACTANVTFAQQCMAGTVGAADAGAASCNTPTCPSGGFCQPGTGACLCVGLGQPPCGRTASSSGTCCAQGQTCTNNQCTTPTCTPACPAAATCMSGVCVCSNPQAICGRTASSSGTCCGPGQTCTNNQCQTRTNCGEAGCSAPQTCQDGVCTCPTLPACGGFCGCLAGDLCQSGQCVPLDGGVCSLPGKQCTTTTSRGCCVGACSNRDCFCGYPGTICNGAPNGCCSGVCQPADSSGTRLCTCSPVNAYCYPSLLPRDTGCCTGLTCDSITQKCVQGS